MKNIFNKITLQGLKKNRTRTIVTIIGVILSAAMITAVTAFIASLQNNLIQSEIAASGGWHVKFADVDSAFIEKITAGKEVKTVAVTRNVGYTLLGENQNPSKPYLFITAFDDGAFSAMPIKLIEGRTPQNSGEILIPEHIEISGSVSYEVGETLELSLGKRMIDGLSVDQNTSFQNGSVKETFMPNTSKAYTIVGIYKRPGFERYSAPGYTAITKIDDLGGSAGYDALVMLKSPGQVYSYAEKTAENVSYEYNRSLLRLYGVSTNDGYNAVLYSLGGILIALIMVGSVLLIYNSFAISVSERSRQFGILSSVGATKKQLRKSVLFEGVCIGAIGIPLGLAAGAGGIGVTLRLISWITKSMFANEIPLTLSLSWPALAVAAAVSAVTILISAYIPARRAFRKSAIDIIRQSDDIKIKAKEIKTSKLVGLLFGLEGTLALKNFKRNKKRYRSTVISLFVSVVLFIAASAFGMYLKQGTEMTVGDYGFDIAFGASQGSYHLDDEELLRLYDKMNSAPGVTAGAYKTDLNCAGSTAASEFTEEFLQYDDAGVAEVPTGGQENSTARIWLAIEFVDDATYVKYLETLGLPAAEYSAENGKLPAVARKIGYDNDLQRTVSFDVFKNRSVSIPVVPSAALANDTFAAKNITFTIVEELPALLSRTDYYGFTAFAPYSAKSLFPVSEDYYSGISMNFSSDDPQKSAAEMEDMMAEAGVTSGYTLFNVAEALEQSRNILLVINIFTYGFVVLISLITIANVFNTVSTGINLRKREFAMLRSVGLNSRGFNKMMSFECLFYGLKALLYGLPVSAGITYLIYRAVLNGVDVSFTLPWGSIAISVCGVFLVVFVTMIYAVSGIKNVNVIEALRDETA